MWEHVIADLEFNSKLSLTLYWLTSLHDGVIDADLRDRAFKFTISSHLHIKMFGIIQLIEIYGYCFSKICFKERKEDQGRNLWYYVNRKHLYM